MFLSLPKFEWGCFNWLKFDLDCCDLPKYLQYISHENRKKLFKFAQMVPIVPRFEWSCFNYPNMIEAVGSAQIFVIVCKFKWSFCILPKLNWSCLKFPKLNKAVWSYPKLKEDVPLGPNLNGAIAISPELKKSVGV